MKNVFQIKADIKGSKMATSPFITQNDAVRFEVSLFDGDKEIDLSSVTTSTLASTRGDKETVVVEGEKTGVNKVTFNIGTAETKLTGEVNAVVQLYGADGRVSTVRFIYKVTSDPTGAGFIPSEREKTLIEVVLGDGPLVVERAETAATYIEDKKLLIDKFTGEQTNLQAQLDQVAIGATNAETSQARLDTKGVSHTTLKARLDKEMNEVNSSLAEKVNKGDLTNILDGSPKGSYPTFVDLQTAHPNGTTGVYLVKEDGHIYSWNGSVWTDLGLYQASVSEFKNMLAYSNIPTSLTTTAGARVHIKNDGLWVQFGSYSATYQKLSVVAGEKYYSKVELLPETTATLSNTTRLIYADGTYTQIANLNNTATRTSAILTADKTSLANITVSVTVAGNLARKNQLFVNLTKLFGAGNEPSIAEFEELLSAFPNSWFDTVNQFDRMQSLILRKFVEVANRGQSQSSQQFQDEETGKLYNYNLKQQDGFVVFQYEEVQ